MIWDSDYNAYKNGRTFWCVIFIVDKHKTLKSEIIIRLFLLKNNKATNPICVCTSTIHIIYFFFFIYCSRRRLMLLNMTSSHTMLIFCFLMHLLLNNRVTYILTCLEERYWFYELSGFSRTVSRGVPSI